MSTDLVVVDDDELTLELLGRRLRNTTVRLQCFTDGGRAIRYLRDHESDVLLVDHRMPKQSGLEVLRELAGSSGLQSTRAYLCSAVELPADIAAEAHTLGAATLSKDLYRSTSDLLELLSSD